MFYSFCSVLCSHLLTKQIDILLEILLYYLLRGFLHFFFFFEQLLMLLGLSLQLSWERICLQCRRPGGFDSWVGKSPWRRKWQPTPVFLPGKSHGQRSLAGYSPWGHTVRHDLATRPPPPPNVNASLLFSGVLLMDTLTVYKLAIVDMLQCYFEICVQSSRIYSWISIAE